MSLGTIVYDKKIYNLDYMTADEIKDLLNFMEKQDVKTPLTSEKIELNAILKSVYTNKISVETINTKMNHQLNSIEFTIDRINPKFRENSKNYDKIKDELITSLSEYELVLKQFSQKYDKKIEDLILNKVELENKLVLEISNENNDTENDETIKKLKKEIKLLTKKINQLNEKKKNKLFESLEVGEKGISTQIRKPKTFSKITKFFSNRFNTHNVIMKNVIEPLKSRIDEFKTNELKNKKEKIYDFNLKHIQEKIDSKIK